MAETPDALMLLVQRLSEMQLEQGKALREHTTTQHEISTALAVLNTRLEPLSALAGDIQTLQLQVNSNTARLAIHSDEIEALHTNVDTLKGSSATRAGWERVLSAVGMVILGAVLTVVARSFIPTAQAAPMDTPPKFEHPCWQNHGPSTNDAGMWL